MGGVGRWTYTPSAVLRRITLRSQLFRRLTERMSPDSMQTVTLAAWKDEYRLGDAEIDQQHQELFEIAERLCEHAEDAPSVDLIEELARLMTYACTHLYTEEAFMKRIGYPGLEGHRQAHAALQRQMMELADRVQAQGTAACGAAAANLVRTWVHDHVLNEDMRIKRYLLRIR